MKRVLWLLGYLWMAPLALAGFFVLFAFELRGVVEWSRFEGPVYLVRVGGRFAAWLASRGWYGHTVGPFVFLWVDADQQEIAHEKRHVRQQMVLGVFHVLIYAASYLWGLLRYRNAHDAYHHCVLERDARRSAGQEE